MNSVYIFILILLLFSIYFIIPFKNEYFQNSNTNSNPGCYSFNTETDNCGSINSASLGRINFNKVCPTDPNCVGQCINMFTWDTDSFNGQPVDIGTLKEPNHKNYYFCTRCNECMNNFYDSLNLLNTPHQQSCPSR